MNDNLDLIMIQLCKTLCKEADKMGTDRDSVIQNFAEGLLELTKRGTFKDFKTK